MNVRTGLVVERRAKHSGETTSVKNALQMETDGVKKSQEGFVLWLKFPVHDRNNETNLWLEYRNNLHEPLDIVVYTPCILCNYIPRVISDKLQFIIYSDRKGNKLETSKTMLTELQSDFNTLMGPVLEQVFKHFDTDNSGNLDSSELKAAFEAAGRPADEETIASAIKALDTDGDGEISLEEFKAIAWRVSLG